MGYYSDLTIKCTIDVAHEIYHTLSQHDIPFESSCSKQYAYFELSDLKWYDSRSEVVAVNAVISTLGKDNKATMLRIGEEDGDIEIYGAEPYYLDLHYYTHVEIEGLDGDAKLTDYLLEHHSEYLL